MSKRIFHQHPLAEVVLGITYKKLLFPYGTIFKIQPELLEDYPDIEILAPLTDELLVNDVIQSEVDIQKSGQVLYRFRSSDSNWLLQLQGNKIYLNWTRRGEQPEFYPGFDTIFAKFKNILEGIDGITGEDTIREAKSYELGYYDRFDWARYIDKLRDIGGIVDYSLPGFLLNSELATGKLNFASRFISEISELNGYCLTVIASDVMATETKVLRVEHSIRGLADIQNVMVSNESRDAWFSKAHKIQNSMFDKLYSEKVQEQWKQP